MTRLKYENKILLRVDKATMDMVRDIAKKENKTNISAFIRQIISDFVNKVIHS